MNYLLVISSVLGVASLFCIFRIAVGPTAPDRVVGLDTLTAFVTVLIILLGVYYQKDYYLDIAIVYALLSFIGILAIARCIDGKEIRP